MTTTNLRQNLTHALDSIVGAVVIGLAVYRGLDLARSALAGDPSTAYLPYVASAQAVETLEERVAKLEDLLVHVSGDGSDIHVSGANLHLVNSEGSAHSTNESGNIVVGCSEDVSEGVDLTPHDRSGSQALVAAFGNGHSSCGGMIFGLWSTASEPYATVAGAATPAALVMSKTARGGPSRSRATPRQRGLRSAACLTSTP